MDIVVQVDQNASSEKTCNVHLLPFAIPSYTGAANVTEYFISHKVTKEGASTDTVRTHYLSSFRGRELRGDSVTLPNTYCGLVVREDEDTGIANEDEIQTLHWTANHMFDKLMYWNREQTPSSNDSIHRWFGWTDVANNIHAPLTLEDLKSLDQSWQQKEEEEHLAFPNSDESQRHLHEQVYKEADDAGNEAVQQESLPLPANENLTESATTPEKVSTKKRRRSMPASKQDLSKDQQEEEEEEEEAPKRKTHKRKST